MDDRFAVSSVAQLDGDMGLPRTDPELNRSERRWRQENPGVIGKAIALGWHADQRATEVMIVVLVVIDGHRVDTRRRNDETADRLCGGQRHVHQGELSLYEPKTWPDPRHKG